MKRKHQSRRGNEHRSDLELKGGGRAEVVVVVVVGGGWGGDPSSYVLWEMNKTNICPSAVGHRPLNGCTAGRERCTPATSATSHPAKCSHLSLTARPSLPFIHPVRLRRTARRPARVCVCVRACAARVIRLIEVWGLCCSQSLSHISKRQTDTTARQLH